MRRASGSSRLQTVRLVSCHPVDLPTQLKPPTSLLKSKESVVLYVAHDNKAALKVYHRVGFVGLDEKNSSVDGVEPWLEVGFDRKAVELGHW